MTKTVAPIPDLKVQCHCTLDTFVSRVDQRAKHSSGLAIHEPPPQPSASFAPGAKPPPKTKFYLAAEKEYKDRGKPNEVMLRNLARKKAVGEKIERRVRKAAKQRGRWSLVKANDCPSVDVVPDPVRMAQFRYKWLVKFSPEELFGLVTA
jgi:hypothetical protein